MNTLPSPSKEYPRHDLVDKEYNVEYNSSKLETVVQMTADDVALAWWIAVERDRVNKGNGVRDRIQAKRLSPVEINVIGYLGEIALHDLIGAPLDVTTHSRGQGCDTLVGGLKVDVKTTDRVGVGLVIYKQAWERMLRVKDVDIIVAAEVLAWGSDRPRVRIKGWLGRPLIEKRGVEKVLLAGKPPCLVIERRHLLPFNPMCWRMAMGLQDPLAAARILMKEVQIGH